MVDFVALHLFASIVCSVSDQGLALSFQGLARHSLLEL
jgi:hypothetical protein